MKSGELRKIVTLESPTHERDAQGQLILGAWTNERVCWSKIEPLAGREYSDDAQVVGETQHRVTIRWKPGQAIDSSWRLVYGERVLEIDSIVNLDERNRTAVLLCRETTT